MPIRKNLFSFLLLLPILQTPFIYYDELFNGVISAKQIWFYAAMALLLAGSGLQPLFQKRPMQIALNRVDVALLFFYGYLAIRAATTPYIPMLHNVRFINYGLCVALYFVVKSVFGRDIINTVTRRHGEKDVLNTESQKHEEELQLNAKAQRHEEFVEKINLESTPESKKSENVIANEDKQSIDNKQIASSASLLRNDETTFRSEFNFSGFVASCSILYWVIAFLVLTGLAQAIWGLLQLYGFLPSFNSNFKITGTFYNPAPYALYLAAIFPMALGAYLFSSVTDGETLKICGNLWKSVLKLKLLHRGTQSQHGVSQRGFILDVFVKCLSLLTVIAILLVLPATMIRAAWLGAIAGSVLVLQYKYQFIQSIQQFLNTRARRITALALTLTVIAALGAGLYHIKKDSANGKLFIWEVTLGKIAEKPLFGHGVGRFEAEYNNWQAEFFRQRPDEMEGPKAWVAGNTKYAFNEFLEITSETGVVGLVLFLILIATIFPIYNHTDNAVNRKLSNRKWLDDNTVNSKLSNSKSKVDNAVNRKLSNSKSLSQLAIGQSLLVSSSIIALLIPMFISLPLFSLPTFILFFVLLGLGSAFIGPLKSGNWHLLVTWPQKFLALAFFTLAFFLTTTTKNQYNAYYYWDEADELYKIEAYPEACLSFEKVSMQLHYNGLFLQYHGKAVYMNQQYAQADTLLKQAQNFTSDEVLYTTLGDNHKVLKQYEQAEQAYQTAATMAPGKLYPLYLLAKLYDETNQREKALAIAKRVLEKEIKVESTAIDEIKEEMRKIIEKHKAKALYNNDIKIQNTTGKVPLVNNKEGAYRSLVSTAKFMLQKW